MTAMLRHPFAPMYAAAVIVCALFVGYYAVYPISSPPEPAAQTTAPDWTAAPCTLWSDSATPPVVPPYTLTDRCVDADGTVIYKEH